MQIKTIRELSVPLTSAVANAVVNFSSHTVSLVALVSDQTRNGKPVVGLGFNSIGRFAQSGILRERMIPRLLSAPSDALLDPHSGTLDPSRVAYVAMTNEKPGGHGDRSGAVAALELAAWDLIAKLADQPAYMTIAQAMNGKPASDGAPVYAAGGYYYPNDSILRLRDEIRAYQDLGYQQFKIKIGGASINEDMRRVEAAVQVAGNAQCVAVDANARFDLATALEYSAALSEQPLRWFEEPCDPLDFATLQQIIERHPGPIATGENLFSAIDATNLATFGAMRPNQDIFQMDPGLMYGICEYATMLNELEERSFSRAQCLPHGGHLINLHIVTALGLGGCEAYPNVFQPFGGYAPQCVVQEGRVWPSDAPGFGLEQKPELRPHLDQLLGDLH